MVEFYDSISFGIEHRIGKDDCTVLDGGSILELRRQSVAIENIVAQDQRACISMNKVFRNQEGLRDSARVWLHGVAQLNTPAASVSQQLPEQGSVVGRGDNQYVTNSREHERTERVVNHGLVVDREKLLDHRMRDWVEPRPRSAGENDSLHCASLSP